MTTVRTKDGEMPVAGTFPGEVLADQPQPRRPNRVAGEVAFEDHQGRTVKLRPTFEAALEIEDKLGGLDALRLRVVSRGLPGMGGATTRELGMVIAAGVRASGEDRITDAAAARFAYDCGRERLAKPLGDFLHALINGGRLREDDLKNGGSPSGSLSEPGGGDVTELMREIESRSDGYSG